MKKFPLYLILVLLVISAFAQLLRPILDHSIVIGPVVFPPWSGSVFFVVNILLAAWGFVALKGLKPKER